MSFLPTLDDVKAIAVDDAKIQSVTDSDTVWLNMVTFADKIITEAIYGELEFEAQTYFAAHVLSMSAQPVGGRGPLSSESIGGVSQSFTLPWLNRTTVLGGTQFGIMYLEIRNMINAAVVVVKV